MSLVRIITEIETDSGGNISVRSIKVEPAEELTIQRASSHPHAYVHNENAVRRFTQELSDNDGRVVKALLDARTQGTVLYRGDLLKLLGFTELLQWNGVSAWITRKWRRAIGDPYSDLTSTRWEGNDYRIEFSPGIPEETLQQMSLELGI